MSSMVVFVVSRTLADPAGDLLQMQPGEGAGVGRRRDVSARSEDHVAVEVAV